MSTERPARAADTASAAVTVVFPTPPLPATITTWEVEQKSATSMASMVGEGVRKLRLAGFVLLALCVWASTARAQENQRGRIDVVQVNGLLDPSNAALIHSALDTAEREHASALVFQLDGSGAIDTNVESLVNDGATRDRSDRGVGRSVERRCAGRNCADRARHPATRLARPARRSGRSTRSTTTIRRARSPARTRSWLKTITEKSPTLQDFVASLDGRTINGVKVSTLRGDPGHRTLSANVYFHKLDLGQQLAHTLDSPWVAYFLFVVGLLLIVFEFFTAGVGIAGFIGACALVGACFGFSHLPVEYWAVGLLMLGVFGLAIDVQAGGLGVWTFIGGASLVAGSLWLYGGSSQLDPNWWVLVLVIAGAIVFMLSGMTAMIRARFSTPTIGREELIGEMGAAVADIDPDGVVRVRDALWRARTNRATPIHNGDAVRVVSVEGVVLEVEPESGGAKDYRHGT